MLLAVCGDEDVIWSLPGRESKLIVKSTGQSAVHLNKVRWLESSWLRTLIVKSGPENVSNTSSFRRYKSVLS